MLVVAIRLPPDRPNPQLMKPKRVEPDRYGQSLDNIKQPKMESLQAIRQ
jgi:hypothetical protein